MSLINPPLYLFLSSSFSPLSSKLLGTKDKIRRISVPFFCTVLYHVRSTGNCFSLSLRRHVHKFSKYSRMLNLATTGSTLRARRQKYTATWTIMVWTRCIYHVSVLSLLLALVNDLSNCTPWIYYLHGSGNSEWWKRLNLICFEGGEMSKPLYLCRETCSVFDDLVVELKSQMTTDESRAWVEEMILTYSPLKSMC